MTQSADGLHNDCSDQRCAKVRFSRIVVGLGFQIIQLSQFAIASCADQMSFVIWTKNFAGLRRRCDRHQMKKLGSVPLGLQTR